MFSHRVKGKHVLETLSDIGNQLPIAKELAWGDLYLPPLLVAILCGLAATAVTVKLCNHLGWHRYIANPPLVELSLTAIYTVLLGMFVFPY